jgi:RNA polymerase sigma factor (sigma-70 family)
MHKEQAMGNEGVLRVGFTVKMKQGDLLEAIRRRGWTQKKAAEFLDVDQTTFSSLINLKWVPNEFSEELTQKLLELTDKSPEELFPGFIRRKEFLESEKVRDFYVNATPQMLQGTALPQLPAAPDAVVFEIERGAIIEEVLGTIPEHLAQVVRLRFLEDKTLKEVGQQFNVCPERARQWEAKALRFLRHPDRARTLKKLVEGAVDDSE